MTDHERKLLVSGRQAGVVDAAMVLIEYAQDVGDDPGGHLAEVKDTLYRLFHDIINGDADSIPKPEQKETDK